MVEIKKGIFYKTYSILYNSFYSVSVTNHYPLYTYVGFKYLPPPPLPSNHVHRQTLLGKIASNYYRLPLTIISMKQH